MSVESLPARHLVDAAGKSLGAFAGIRRREMVPDPDHVPDPDAPDAAPPMVERVTEEHPDPPAAAVREVPTPPEDARQVWDATAGAWGPPPPPPTPADRAAAELAQGVFMRALVAELAARFSVTPAALVASIRARATE